MIKREAIIQAEVRIALSPHGIVFRTNAGDFWQGTVVYSKEFKQNVLINMRRVHGLPDGFSDLLHVGEGYVAFVETKTATGRTTPEQDNFIDLMKRHGHRAGVARSVEDALRIIKGESV